MICRGAVGADPIAGDGERQHVGAGVDEQGDLRDSRRGSVSPSSLCHAV
jgi:hypothetical protein